MNLLRPYKRTIFIALTVLVSILFYRKYIQMCSCLQTNRLDGKVAIVTGANSGVGKAISADFASRGAFVIMACRSESRCLNAKKEIEESFWLSETIGRLDTLKLDLSSYSSIRSFAKQVLAVTRTIDILVNNAGIMTSQYSLTEAGIESMFGVNHLGPFLLTNLLLPRIKASAPSRIVNVASGAHDFGKVYDHQLYLNESTFSLSGMQAYSDSKLHNVIFTAELIRRLNNSKVVAYSVCPGFVYTNLFHTMWPFSYVYNTGMSVFMKTPLEGAQQPICLAVDPEYGARQAEVYHAFCKSRAPNPLALDEDIGRRSWKESARLTGLDVAD